MGNKLEMVLTREEIERIKENLDKRTIMVDLNGLKVKSAKRLLMNLMALNRDGYDIYAIHGYHGGTAIKQMITNDLSSPRLIEKRKVKRNEGVTILTMQAA